MFVCAKSTPPLAWLLLVGCTNAQDDSKPEDTGDASGFTTTILEGHAGQEAFGSALASARSPQTSTGAPALFVAAPYSYSDLHRGAVYMYEAEQDSLAQTARLTGIPSETYTDLRLASGRDVTGDGLDDLVIGTPFADSAGADAGQLVILSEVLDGQSFTDGHSLEPEGEFDLFGGFVACIPDFDADGVDDVVAFAPYAGAAEAGTLYVLSASITSVLDAYATFEGVEYAARFGAAAASVYDVDGDDVPELAIASRGDPTAAENAGAVYLFYGGEPGTHGPEEAYTMVLGDHEGDALGWSLSAAANFRGDAREWLLLGAPGDDKRHEDGGTVYALDPATTGVQALADLHVVVYGESAAAALGWTIAGGVDLAGDEGSEALIGAPSHVDTDLAQGAAYLLEGGEDAPSRPAVLFELVGEGEAESLGAVVHLADDLDGDGLGTAAVAAPGADASGPDAGSVVLINWTEP